MGVIDIVIVVIFLVTTLVVGIGSSSKIKTIQDYALGGRNFTTGALVATIVATFASASGFFTDLNSTYTDGLFYIVPALSLSLGLLIIAYTLVPRMGEFMGSTSIAEVMGNLYGKEARIITAVAGTIAAIGSVAVQFKAFGNITSYFTGISSTEAIIVSGVTVTIYSTLGGVSAVTRTDILQFFTFGFVIPVIGIIMWNQMYYDNQSVEHVFASDNFKLSELTNIDNPKFWPMISLVFYFAVPSLFPAMFQRILIGSNLRQVKKAFTISAFLVVLVILATCWIAFLALSMNDDLKPDQLLGFIIDKYSYNGLKGLIIIGIIAMAMSTADSILNATSVLFSHDILAPLNIGIDKELSISKWFSVGLGFSAIIFAFYGKNLLSIILLANSFYMPIVTIPLTLAILGFRSTKKSVLIAMSAALITVITLKILDIGDPIFCGMLANIIFLFGSHYYFKQEGGFVGIKDKKSYMDMNVQSYKTRMKKADYNNFSFVKYCQKYFPNNEMSYTGLGIYFIVFTITTMYSVHSELLIKNRDNILIIYQIMMVTGVVIATYPIWPVSLRQELKQTIAQIAWPITSFFMLVFFNIFFLLISNFGLLQSSIFSINLVIVSILVGWRLASIMVVIGICIVLTIFNIYFSELTVDFSIGSPGFICAYTVMIIATTLIIFIKPRQAMQQLVEEQNQHLSGRVGTQEQELKESAAIKSEFIRNVTHEYHAPMTGISSMAQILAENYDQLTDEQRKQAAKTLLDSSLRLEVFDANISSLSKLSKGKLNLKLETINLSNLVEESVSTCRRLYEKKPEDKKWVLDIDEEITANLDKYYFKQCLDNLIINTISYCHKGKIEVVLKQNKYGIHFSISDEGVGIPIEELYDIFAEFTVSSRTRTLAGGRGIGLTLCKKVIEIHGGTIKAESDGKKGAKFTFVLP